MNIKKETAELIKSQYNIPSQVTVNLFIDELLTENQCRKILIRSEYLRTSSKLRLTEIKEMLADKYCLSLSTVEKYLAGI